MDRDWLAAELGGGRSVGDIAREVGRHPATVAYWVNKHGLVSRHAAKYATRGGLDEDQLRNLVESGLSVRQIAAQTHFGPTAVRHWLRRFGLRTQPARYSIRGEPKPNAVVRKCTTHGWIEHRLVGRSRRYRCPRCEAERVTRRRRKAKAILVAEAGGACAICGYNRCVAALHFHHLDPARKRFQMGERGLTRALEILREEAEKCVLLCANCHAEVEAGHVPADTLKQQNGPG